MIVKLSVVPNTDVDSYMAMTDDFDVFNPYTNPELGKVMTLQLTECDNTS